MTDIIEEPPEMEEGLPFPAACKPEAKHFVYMKALWIIAKAKEIRAKAEALVAERKFEDCCAAVLEDVAAEDYSELYNIETQAQEIVQLDEEQRWERRAEVEALESQVANYAV